MSQQPTSRPWVYIAAMGRSGSTMLANLLHDPPARVMLMEPNLLSPTPSDELRWQLREVFGAEGRSQGHPQSQPDLSALDGSDKWGLKEVRADLHESVIRQLDPVHIVVLLRDPVAASLSLYEKGEVDGDLARLPWLESRMSEPLRVLPRVAAHPRAVVTTYERLVQGTETRAALAEHLDWPLTGDVSRGLERWGRSREVALHGGKVTSHRAQREVQDASEQAQAFAARVTTQAAAVVDLHKRATDSPLGLLTPEPHGHAAGQTRLRAG